MNLLIIGSQHQVSCALKSLLNTINEGESPDGDTEFKPHFLEWMGGPSSVEETASSVPSVTAAELAAEVGAEVEGAAGAVISRPATYWEEQFMLHEADYLIIPATETELPKEMRLVYLQVLTAIVDACCKLDLPVIFLSDYHVFDGIKHSPYVESDSVSPYNDFGRMVTQWDALFQEKLKRYLIVRTGWVYSAYGDNHLTRLIACARAGEELRYNPAHVAGPTSANDLARVIVAMLRQLACGAECWGSFHYTGDAMVSGYQFAEAVLAISGQYDRQLAEQGTQLIDKAGSQNELLAIAPVALACQKILNNFGIKRRPWRSSLEVVIREFYRDMPGESELGNTKNEGAI